MVQKFPVTAVMLKYWMLFAVVDLHDHIRQWRFALAHTTRSRSWRARGLLCMFDVVVPNSVEVYLSDLGVPGDQNSDIIMHQFESLLVRCIIALANVADYVPDSLRGSGSSSSSAIAESSADPSRHFYTSTATHPMLRPLKVSHRDACSISGCTMRSMSCASRARPTS